MPNTGPKTTLKSNPKTHQKTGDSTESITAEGILDRAFMQLWHRRWTQVQSVNFSATAFELIFPVCPRLISTCLPISILTYLPPLN